VRRSYTSTFEDDVVSALEWTLENFGNSAMDRYAKLIEIALRSLSGEPLPLASREFETVRLYHLTHSKKDAPVDGVIVNNPRHLLVYRVDGNTLEFLRLLHERMDIVFT